MSERVRRSILASAGPHATLISHDERPWMTATLSGARHDFQIQWERSNDPAVTESILPFWPPADFEIPGMLIADIEVCGTVVDFVPRLQLTAEFSMLTVDLA
ncbi:hypothetical protein [Novosphingobium sp. FSW06-99]|uniref:hypothetical protein n=1 Tax=Novosphingobium sp. FSW06-99 TaxID=1739113 RepID=UPI00076D246C|nr:hypothetical protein [Novosphingobium sp. FSW06-99]KUR80773.1 hypothetical protein AQZ49_01730 [Novosphingobium sp. FSW06-99]